MDASKELLASPLLLLGFSVDVCCCFSDFDKFNLLLTAFEIAALFLKLEKRGFLSCCGEICSSCVWWQLSSHTVNSISPRSLALAVAVFVDRVNSGCEREKLGNRAINYQFPEYGITLKQIMCMNGICGCWVWKRSKALAGDEWWMSKCKLITGKFLNRLINRIVVDPRETHFDWMKRKIE